MAESEAQPPAHDETNAIPPEGAADKERVSSPPNAPPAPEIPPPPLNRERQHCRPDQTPLWKYTLEYVAAVCSIALVIITAYYTRAAYRQAMASETAAKAARDAVKVARDTLTETQASNASQTISTEKARESSERNSTQTLEATIDQFHQDQRAWLGVVDSSVNFSQCDTSTPAGHCKVTLDIKNTGKTPALDIKRASAFSLSSPVMDSGPRPAYQNIIDNQIKAAQGERSLAPGNTTTMISDDNGNYVAPKWDKIAAQKLFVEIYGRLNYFDIFGRKHSTLFCYYIIDPSTKLTASCEKYNEMN